jgi:RAB protein geranylgeranyltransferase component A
MYCLSVLYLLPNWKTQNFTENFLKIKKKKKIVKFFFVKFFHDIAERSVAISEFIKIKLN